MLNSWRASIDQLEVIVGVISHGSMVVYKRFRNLASLSTQSCFQQVSAFSSSVWRKILDLSDAKDEDDESALFATLAS